MSIKAGPHITASEKLILNLDASNVDSTSNITRNLLVNTEDFTDNPSFWAFTDATVRTNATEAPDGTMTADMVIGNAGIATKRRINQSVTGLKAGTSYTFSVYLKSAGYTYATIWHDDNPYAQPAAYTGFTSLLNLVAGTSSDTAYTTMTAVGNGWYRCQVTAFYPYSGNYSYSISVGAPNGGAGTPNGDGKTGIYVWGAQLEASTQAFQVPALDAPTLELNFDQGVTGVTTMSPLITFSRSTVGTYYDSNGLIATAAINVPRYDYDPITLTNRGLLIETSTTNYIPNSTQSTSQFTFFGGVTTALANSNTPALSTVVVNGVRKLTASDATVSQIKYMLRAETWTAGWINIFSAFFKQASANITYPVLVMDDGATGGVYARFDLSGSGTVVQSSDTGEAVNYGAGIEQLPNGWYRCWVVGTTPAGAGRAAISIRYNTNTGNGYDPGYVATAVGDGVYVWGPMIEKNVGQRRKPSSYVETNSVILFKGGDTASIAGTNFSSFFNNTEGTILVEYYRSYEDVFGGDTCPISISNGSSSNQISLFNIGGKSTVTNNYYVSGGTYQLDYAEGTSNLGINRLAQSYKTNQVAFAANGSLVSIDYTNATPTVNQLRIGYHVSGTNDLNDRISRIIYWSNAATATELANLTDTWSSGITTSGVQPSTYYPVNSTLMSDKLLDLSGNNVMGKITGTHTYDTTSYGAPVIALNNKGTTSDGKIILTTKDLDILAKSYNFTVMFAARKRFYGLGGGNNGNSEIFQGVPNGSSTGWRISETSTGTPGKAFGKTHTWQFGFNDTVTSVSVSDTIDFANRMCICAFTVSSDTITAFVNGNFNTIANPKTYVGATSTPIISVNTAGKGSFNGEIGFFTIYDRALSQDEITQNFNALRSRYGI
jgi:hypothetical protein